MKNNIACNVIVDLLPLYKEEICSEETKILVEEHLAECADCRRLSEQVTIPEVGKKEAPTENEAFKKVGKKLKKSRFTKFLSVLMCICIALFAVVNAAWYFLEYRPAKQICEGMEKIAPYDDVSVVGDGVRKVSVYASTDDKYMYAVQLPRYLEFTSIKMSVAPKDVLFFHGNGMRGIDSRSEEPILCMSFCHNLSPSDRVEVTASFDETYDGQKTKGMFIFFTDYDFKAMKEAQYLEPEDTAKLREFIEAHRDELNDMKKAAQNKWGEYLK